MNVSGQLLPNPLERGGGIEASSKAKVDSRFAASHAFTVEDSNLTIGETYTEALGAAAFGCYVSAITLHAAVAQTSGSITARIKADGVTVLETVIDTATDSSITIGGADKYIAALAAMEVEIVSAAYNAATAARVQVHLVNTEALPYEPFTLKSEFERASESAVFNFAGANQTIIPDTRSQARGELSVQYNESTGQFTFLPGIYLFVLNLQFVSATTATAGKSTHFKLHNVTDGVDVDGAAAQSQNVDAGGGNCGTMFKLLIVTTPRIYEVRNILSVTNAGIGGNSFRAHSSSFTVLRID